MDYYYVVVAYDRDGMVSTYKYDEQTVALARYNTEKTAKLIVCQKGIEPYVARTKGMMRVAAGR